MSQYAPGGHYKSSTSSTDIVFKIWNFCKSAKIACYKNLKNKLCHHNMCKFDSLKVHRSVLIIITTVKEDGSLVSTFIPPDDLFPLSR